jgi:hypothetical protein
MNIFDLLSFLHPDLAEWERQRRLRGMRQPDDRFMDGPLGAVGGVVADTPRIRNFANEIPLSFGPEAFLDRLPPDPKKIDPLYGPKTKRDKVI